MMATEPVVMPAKVAGMNPKNDLWQVAAVSLQMSHVDSAARLFAPPQFRRIQVQASA
jgi:hypothetical protein